MSPFTHFAEAAHAYANLVAQVRPEQWEAPGLGVWDVRALAGHGARALVTVDTYLDRPAAEIALDSPVAYLAAIQEIGRTAAGDPDAVAERGRQAGGSLGADPAQTVRELVDRVLARAETALAAGDPVIETIGGGMRLSDYLPTRTFELVVHGLDLARALHQPTPPWSADLVQAIVDIATGAAVRHGDGPTLLLALAGREPLPAGFSVV